MFTKTTHNVKVTAVPHFLAEHSAADEDHFVWAYTIQIENYGDKPVQLVGRHWQITDVQGVTQEVNGPGVIGEQPVLKPGESFRYTSGTALGSPSGVMLGSYEMVADDGEHFKVEIPAFSLDSPYQVQRLN